MSFGVIHSQPHDGWQESEDYHVLGPRKLCPSAVWIALDLGLMSKLLPPALSAARRASVRRVAAVSCLNAPTKVWRHCPAPAPAARASARLLRAPERAVVGAAPAPPRCREALMELPPGVRATETMTPDLRRDGGATAR